MADEPLGAIRDGLAVVLILAVDEEAGVGTGGGDGRHACGRGRRGSGTAQADELPVGIGKWIQASRRQWRRGRTGRTGFRRREAITRDELAVGVEEDRTGAPVDAD